jgi:hydrogenase expression/formation protein HypC
MAVPSCIRAIDGPMAVVECFGILRQVNLMLLNETVDLGDYVLILSGAFAVEKVDAATAEESLRFFADIIEADAKEF